MNRFQAPFELLQRTTEKTPAVRNNVKLHVQALSEMVDALLDQLQALQSEPNDNDETPYLNLRDEVRRFEIDLITRALTRTNGSQVQAAKLLGLNATTLHAKIKRYRLHLPYLIQATTEPQ